MFYTVRKNNRYFRPGVLYSDIDWSDMATIADAFAGGSLTRCVNELKAA
jgi:hypothetical protein